MAKIQLPIIDTIAKEKILNALIAYFIDENSKLGCEVATEQIANICINLLKDNDNSFSSWQINEQTLFDEYRNEELAIMDYLHLVSLDFRKQLGQYATPANIVKYIYKSVNYASSKRILTQKLIDPACGSGAFLVEAVRIYINALKKAKVPLSKWYPMVTSAITGIDIDPIACFFARLNLSMLLAPAILEFVSRNKAKELSPLPVYCADTLEMISSEKSSQKFMYTGLNIRLKNQFDFVVGNPPYFKIKGLNEDIKKAFSASIYGHPNAYGLFLHAGIEMLRNSGKLGFIVPRSMLSGLYFKNLRNFIEKKTSIKEITCIADRKKVFQNVLHGTMILALQRTRVCKKDVQIARVQSLNHSIMNENRIVIDRNSIVQRLNGTTVWFVADSINAYKIIDRVVKQHPLLSGSDVNCKAKTGQIVWNRIKPLLCKSLKSNALPLVWATDVRKFGFSFKKKEKSRPAFLKADVKISNLIVKGPCIFVQRISADEQPSRIVASLPDKFCRKESKGYFVENHLNIIQPVIKDSTTDLYFILGVLNSEIVEFFFRAMNGNTQVSATELNLLPMPKGRLEKDIAALAKRIQSTSKDTSKSRLMQDLNLLVAKAYGLTKNDLTFIRDFLYSGSRSVN